MAVWVIWLIIAVVLGVAETFTLTAALGLLGAAALITSGLAAIGLPVPLQFLVFAVASAVGVLALRPIAARHLHGLGTERFGVEALAGRTAYVVDEVSGRTGLVHIGGEENFVTPFIDRVYPAIDLREQVVSFEPQPVITEDNLVVEIDTVLYFQVTDPRSAAYKIASYLQGVEQLTVTTLRNVVGSMDLERDKRAAILSAEGHRQSQILTAEGDKQGAILRAEGNRAAAILRAEGQAREIDEVFQAVHRNDPDPKLLAYQYLQVLPQLAGGEGNTLWVIPSEVTAALQGVTRAFTGAAAVGQADGNRTLPRSDPSGPPPTIVSAD